MIKSSFMMFSCLPAVLDLGEGSVRAHEWKLRTLSDPPDTAKKVGEMSARACAQQQASQQKAGREGKGKLACGGHDALEYNDLYPATQEE
jgi:hypothetical protein